MFVYTYYISLSFKFPVFYELFCFSPFIRIKMTQNTENIIKKEKKNEEKSKKEKRHKHRTSSKKGLYQISLKLLPYLFLKIINNTSTFLQNVKRFGKE